MTNENNIDVFSGIVCVLLAANFHLGELFLNSSNGAFSVNAPVDRTIWKNLTYPIQTVCLIDYGPTGPRNGASVNGDWWYRSVDGVRSFRVA